MDEFYASSVHRLRAMHPIYGTVHRYASLGWWSFFFTPVANWFQAQVFVCVALRRLKIIHNWRWWYESLESVHTICYSIVYLYCVFLRTYTVFKCCTLYRHLNGINFIRCWINSARTKRKKIFPQTHSKYVDNVIAHFVER